MLGEDVVGDEGVAATQLSLCDDSAAFPEQVGEDAPVGDSNARLPVLDDKACSDAVDVTFDGVFLDHSAQSHGPPGLRFAGCDVGWRVEIGGSVLQAPHRKEYGAQHSEDREDDEHQPLVLGARDHLRFSSSAAASDRRMET